MDVLADQPPFFGVVLRKNRYKVVLDLKSCSQKLNILDHFEALAMEIFCAFTLQLHMTLYNACDQSDTHPRENTGFIYDHLEVLIFSWHLLPVVPVNIPVLTEVDVHHLL